MTCRHTNSPPDNSIMTGLLAIFIATIVALVGILSAVHARRRRAASEAAQHSSGWASFPGPTGAMPSEIRDLTPLNLGHDRQFNVAFSSVDCGQGRVILEAQFDSGFGERRRRYRFALLVLEAPVDGFPRLIMITRDDILASAARRPGLAVRQTDGVNWISSDGLLIDSLQTRLSGWLATAAPELTIEYRSGQLAIYLPGELGEASQSILIAAAESLRQVLRGSPV